jgi:hypothetical protein
MMHKTLQNPSASAKSAIDATATYMGYSFVARLDGAAYADASNGFAVDATQAMSHNTILHLASCSKVICHAALLAMIEDWTALAAAVAAAGRTPSTTSPSWATVELVSLTVPPSTKIPQVPKPGTPPPPPPHEIAAQVPTWILPVLASRTLAQAFQSAALGSLVPITVADAIAGVAAGTAVVSMSQQLGAHAVPVPGYLGFLTQIEAGVPVPTMSTAFMALLSKRLQATYAQLKPTLPYPFPAAAPGVDAPYGVGAPTFTLAQLVDQTTTLHMDGLSQNILTAIPAANGAQPAGGTCAFDVWAFVLGVLMDAPSPNPGLAFQYNNNNYTMAGAVIAECTGMEYGAYAAQRLFCDPRFSTITPGPGPAPVTLYYNTTPTFGPGVEACNYTGNCSGAGCFFASAEQFTDWLSAAYSCDPSVKSWSGSAAPLLSATDSAALFAKNASAFPTDWDLWAAPDSVTGWTMLAKSGGTGWSSASASGSANSVIGIAVSPDQKHVMTAFFATNCGVNAWDAWQPGVTAAIKVFTGQ